MAMTRREVLALGVGVAALPLPSWARGFSGGRKLKFGLVTDLHQDIMHDGVRRVSAFVEAMRREKGLAFVMQMGDFCVPKEANRGFLEAFKAYPGEQWHVLGNHDTDGGFSQAETMAFWGMEKRYYTFVRSGIRFVVLDANEKGGKRPGYPIFVGTTQIAWLARVLEESKEPVVLVSHQPLAHDSGIENRQEVLRLVRANGKVLVCLYGHDHVDSFSTEEGAQFLCINSASYVWLGDKFAGPSYSEAILEGHPAIRYTAPYKDPVWAVVELDMEAGVMVVRGKSSEWVGPDPWARGATVDRGIVRPAVSSREIGV